VRSPRSRLGCSLLTAENFSPSQGAWRALAMEGYTAPNAEDGRPAEPPLGVTKPAGIRLLTVNACGGRFKVFQVLFSQPAEEN